MFQYSHLFIFSFLEIGAHFLSPIELCRVIRIRFCVLWPNEILWYFLCFSTYTVAKFFLLKKNCCPLIISVARKLSKLKIRNKMLHGKCLFMYCILTKGVCFYDINYYVVAPSCCVTSGLLSLAQCSFRYCPSHYP